jgi:hypothetical protein
MAQADWMITGARQPRPVVLAPGSTADAADAARVDAALDGFPSGVPAWFRGLERIGYWWYGVCVVAGVLICLAVVPAPLEWRIATGLGAGFVAAPATGAALNVIAHLWSRARGPWSPQEAITRLQDRARPSDGETDKRVAAILAAKPALEARVHDVVWRQAGGEAGARHELTGLWEKEAPEEAARQAALIADVRAKIDGLTSRGER